MTKAADMSVPVALPGSAPAPTGGAAEKAPKTGGGLPFDPFRVVSALLQRWIWIVAAGAVLAVAGGCTAYYMVKPQFTAAAQLMREEATGTFRASELGEPFRPRQLAVPTLVSLMRSAVVLQRVSERTQPRLSPREILGGLTITPERNTDLITITFKSSRSGEAAMRVLNVYGAEIVRMTRDMQAQEATEVNRLLKQQLTKADDDLRTLNTELLTFSREAGLISADKEIDAYLRKLGELDLRYESTRIEYETLDLKITALEKELAEHNPLAERLQSARERLADLRALFKDANPLVAEQQERVTAAEKQLAEASGKPIAPPRQGESGIATSFYQDLHTLRTQKEVLAAQLDKLKSVRAGTDERLRALPEKGMQYARIKARQQSLEAAQSILASRQREAQLYEENPLGYYRFFETRPDQVDVAGRGRKVLVLATAGGFAGAGLAFLLVALIELLDDRIKTLADVRRVTRLPVLARLPDLAELDAVAQSTWAFRTWMALQAQLQSGPDRALVCGVAASSAAEGCSTWLELLGHAAAQREGRVLVVTNRTPRNGVTVDLDEALRLPDHVRPEPGSPLWLFLPGSWRWDAGTRAQWQAALAQWRSLPGLVVLIEITGVDQPETLLFAESLTQLVWLVGSRQAHTGETRHRLEVLRHAKCHLAGVVVNRTRPLIPWVPQLV